MSKSWETMSLTEQKTAFRDFLAHEINLALEQGLTFKPNNRAYNTYSGSAYHGLNALILDAKQQEGNYTSNAWISLEEAQHLGADARELEFIHNNTQSSQNPQGSIKKASISYIKTHEMQSEKDSNGNPIPVLGPYGNQRYDKNGDYLWETELVRVEIPPRLEIKHLYNIECFKSLDQTRLKPLNSKSLQSMYVGQYFSAENKNLVIHDLSAKLTAPQYQRVLDYASQYNQYNQQHSQDKQYPRNTQNQQSPQGQTQGAKANQPAQNNVLYSTNQQHTQQFLNQTPEFNPSQHNQEMAMPKELATPNPQEQMMQMMHAMMQMMQEQHKMMQEQLQEQHKTIQKMAQEIAWLKQQQHTQNNALNAVHFTTPSKGRGR
ncbi:ArdC-like ssDNA-binding domain-containing protein [Helicobacter suis]|uniref:ArdC-like ssDNA-binding domain-containing protein n=1 Tax=Helicobacter suis TaxID=104628 RepID=UPI0013CFAE1E|nr:ArdC-like ssDNA-binding domain-containing protein [Helicobacter suis]